jgi:hypothetical protein
VGSYQLKRAKWHYVAFPHRQERRNSTCREWPPPWRMDAKRHGLTAIHRLYVTLLIQLRQVTARVRHSDSIVVSGSSCELRLIVKRVN